MTAASFLDNGPDTAVELARWLVQTPETVDEVLRVWMQEGPRAFGVTSPRDPGMTQRAFVTALAECAQGGAEFCLSPETVDAMVHSPDGLVRQAAWLLASRMSEAPEAAVAGRGPG